MNTHTPKHFVLQLGALISLYVSLTALLLLLFSLINITFPDAAESYYKYDSAQGTARGAIATLIVFFPTYVLLTRLTNQQRRRETAGDYTTLARWMIYLSLLVGGVILLADLVTLIMYFLNGEMTTRLLLKVGALLVVIGAAFSYYLLDIRRYFTTRIARSLYCGLGASVMVTAAIVWGFTTIETPSEVRETRLDEQQVTDLRDIEWRIEEYYRSNERLPETLELAYTVGTAPTAPEDRPSYSYDATGDVTYELCATFATNSARNMPAPRFTENYSWEHEEGEWCFERAVTRNEP